MSSSRRSLFRRVNKRDVNRVAYRRGFYVFLPINETEKSLWRRINIIVKREQEDPSIFAQRFSRSYQLLRLIACRVLGDEERVPLAIKNCWRSASRNPPYFEYEGAFRSWLVRVLIDEALAILRKCPEPAHASEVLRNWQERRTRTRGLLRQAGVLASWNYAPVLKTDSLRLLQIPPAAHRFPKLPENAVTSTPFASN